MYGLDRRYTGVRVDSIRIDLLRIICQKIDLSNPLLEEKHIENAVHSVGRRATSDFLNAFPMRNFRPWYCNFPRQSIFLRMSPASYSIGGKLPVKLRELGW